MADMISNEPLGLHENAAPKLLGIAGSLYIIALFLFSGRIYARIRQRRLGWDDYIIAIALILALTQYSLLLTATIAHNFGFHTIYLSASARTHARHLLFASSILWTVSVAFVRISIACTLLRIKHARSWHIFLWAIITIQILSCFANMVFLLLQCVPMEYVWDPSNHPNAVCVKQDALDINAYVHAGIGTSTDFMLALVPISFLREARRLSREKIALLFITALGLFATAASIVRTTFINHGKSNDTLWDSLDPTLWAILEQQAGILAACLSSLKPVLSSIFRYFPTLSPNTRSPSYEDTSHLHPHHHNTPSHMLPQPHFSHTPHLNLSLTFKPRPNIIPTPSTTAPSIAQSHETIWPHTPTPMAPTPIPLPRGSAEQDEAYRQMLAEGGILLTTEFQIRSEVTSQIGSDDGEERVRGVMQREMEEWRVERPSLEMRTRGWDGV